MPPLSTGNAACTYYESKFAQNRKKRIILIRMIPFGEGPDKCSHSQVRWRGKTTLSTINISSAQLSGGGGGGGGGGGDSGGSLYA